MGVHSWGLDPMRGVLPRRLPRRLPLTPTPPQDETTVEETAPIMRTPWSIRSAAITRGLWILTILWPSIAIGQAKPDLEVIEDPAALTASRREYERIRGLSTGDTPGIGREAGKAAGLPPGFPRGLDAAAVDRLLAEASEDIRLEAASALLDRDRLRGREMLFRLLDSPSPEIRAKALERLSGNLFYENLLWFPPPPEVRVRLLALLDDADPAVRRAAFEPCIFLSGPAISERLLRAIRERPARERAELTWLLSWRADSSACLDAVLEHVGTRDAKERGWVLQSLEVLAERADAAIAERAAAELEKLLLEDLQAGRWTVPYSVRFAAPGLGAPLRALLEADPEADRSPTDPLRAELARTLRFSILETLGQVDPDAGELLLRIVREGGPPEDVGGALRGLLCAKGTSPDAIVRAVLARSSMAPSRGRLDEASVQLLLSRGGTAGRRALLDRFDLLDGYWRCAVLWALHGWKAEDVARELHSAGLARRLPQPDATALKRLRDEGLGVPQEPGSELSFFYATVHWMGSLGRIHYDEMGGTPIGYDGFMEDIVRETGSDLPVDAVWQSFDRTSGADPGIYRIRFAVGTRLYRLSIREGEANATAFGLLLAALNAAAGREGRRERFISFLDFDPHECVYADPATVHAFRMKYFLPAGLGDERLDAEYREHVARTIEELKARLPAAPGGG